MNYSFKKINNKSKLFLCALCSTHRSMKYSKNLTIKHFIQIGLIVASLTYLFWGTFAVNTLLVSPVVWTIFEVTNKIFYRKDVPCPSCGFDATWYRRDVKMAKNKVEQFWLAKEQAKFTKKDQTNTPDLESLM